jgi:dipeptidyl aminopeptidase/acylaminoacyl peptidase
MRTIAGIATACALAAGAAWAHPYTVEDLLSVESLGRVAFSPDGRWLVVERFGGWKTAPTFDNDLFNVEATSRLMVMDLSGPGALRPLLKPNPDAGDTLGPFSPSGARMIVYRMKDRRRELGIVTLATGAVAWSGVSVEPELFAANARWRGEDEVVAIARDPVSSPMLSYGWHAQVKLAEAWAAARRGAFSGAVYGSGRFEALNPLLPANDVVAFIPATGRVRVLAHGRFQALTLAPNGSTAAVISEEERIVLPPDQPASTANPNRRRRLSLIDLTTGRQVAPCPACDLSKLPWRWSPDGKSLLALARTSGTGLGDYRYWRFTLNGAAPLSQTLIPGEVTTQGGVETQPQGDVGWLGHDAIILARDGSGHRLDWWRFTSRGVINLTAKIAAPRGRALAKDDRGILVSTSDGLFRITRQGPRLAAGSSARISLNATVKGETPDAALVWLPTGGRVISPGGGDRPGAAVEDPAEALAVAARGGWAAVTRRRDDGVSVLSVRGPTGADRLVLTLNPWLTGTETRPPAPIHHRGPRGETLTSWLYLPADHQPGDHRRLVVAPYPGSSYPAPPSDRRPDSTRLDTSVPVIVGAGYAVLVPSLPMPMDQEPAPGLADAILAAVDAAGLQQPGLATDRPALWNSSFGGWGVLMAATQSSRFSAIIAAAPITDFVAMHGEQNLAAIADPAMFFAAPASQAYTETGQARVNGPPWKALDRYIRNSPRYLTDKITAPVLIFYGDLDFNPIQAMALFTSLRRQGKDAQMVIYRGESHIILGPDNVRDLYARAFAFLDTAMASDAEPERTLAIRPSQ